MSVSPVSHFPSISELPGMRRQSVTARGAVVSIKSGSVSAVALPAMSTARTVTLCSPSARSANRYPLSAVLHSPPSSCSSYRATPDAASVVAKLTVGALLFDQPEMSDVTANNAGGVTSVYSVRESEVLFPALSTARITTRCVPSPSAANVYPLSTVFHAPPSSCSSYRATPDVASVVAKLTVGVLSLVQPVTSACTVKFSGAAASVYTVSDSSRMFPALSTARTNTSCVPSARSLSVTGLSAAFHPVPSRLYS